MRASYNVVKATPRYILDMELQSGAKITVEPGLHRMSSLRASLSVSITQWGFALQVHFLFKVYKKSHRVTSALQKCKAKAHKRCWAGEIKHRLALPVNGRPAQAGLMQNPMGKG